jgi:hypothetical protein
MGETKVSVLEAVVGRDPVTLGVSAAGLLYTGRLLQRPRQLAVGERLHVRLVVPTSSTAVEDCVDVLCTVTAVEGEVGAYAAAWVPGLRFTLEVTRLSRGCADLPLTAVTPPVLAAPEENSDPTGVLGNLAELPLGEVVQTLEMGRKTARVDLRGTDGVEGHVFVARGAVLDAQTADLSGNDAFFALLRVTRGRFRIRFGREAPRRTIQDPTPYLLMEAARRADEEKRVAPAPVVIAPPLPDIPEGAAFGHFFAEARTGLGPAPTPRSVAAADLLPPEITPSRAMAGGNPFWMDSSSNPPGR